jgi:hypothetical protein
MIRKKRRPTTKSNQGSRPALSSHKNSRPASLAVSVAHSVPPKVSRSRKAPIASTRRSARRCRRRGPGGICFGCHKHRPRPVRAELTKQPGIFSPAHEFPETCLDAREGNAGVRPSTHTAEASRGRFSPRAVFARGETARRLQPVWIKTPARPLRGRGGRGGSLYLSNTNK